MQTRPIETSPNTREKILRAASVAFALKGFKATTIKEIATTAELSEITIFRHFPQKQELYWPAIDWYFRSSMLLYVFRKSLCRDGSPRELLLQVSEDVVQLFRGDPGLVRLFYFTVLELEAEKHTLYEIHIKPLLIALQTRIRVWMHDGALRTGTPSAVALLIAGGVLTHCQMNNLFGDELTEGESVGLSTELIDFCLTGLLNSASDIGISELNS
jgi:AcrR family transcriptional regulator